MTLRNVKCHEASRGLSETAELLVKAGLVWDTVSQGNYMKSTAHNEKNSTISVLTKSKLSRQINSQEAQLSQTGRAILCVMEYFAVTQDHSK